MVRKLLFIFLCAAAFTPLSAQWQQYAPTTTQDNYFIKAYDNQFFYGGGYNTFIRSLDGGVTWDSLPILDMAGNPYPVSGLFGIDFISPSVGIASGAMNLGNTIIMLYTVNGGLNWSSTYSNTGGNYPRNMNSMQYVTPTLAVAVGTNGRILRSINAGSSWTLISAATTAELTDVKFANSTLGFITGDNRVLKTTNGGASWTTVNVPDLMQCLSVVNSTTAYAGSNNGKIYRTTNAGSSWTVLPMQLPGNPWIRDIQFTSLDTGYAVADSAIYKTCNGGVYWECLQFPHALRSVYFRNADDGLLTGMEGNIYHTGNGGGIYAPISTFSIPNSGCPDSVITLTATTDPLYLHKWLLNGVQFATGPSAMLAIHAPMQSDTVTLIVDNGTYADTSHRFIYIEDALTVSSTHVVTSDTLCYGQSTTIKVFNSDPGATYRLRRGTTNIGFVQAGTGGTLTFSTGTITATDTAWNIQATKTVAGCGTLVTRTYHTIVISSPDMLNIPVAVPDTLCAGQNAVLYLDSSETGVSYQFFIGSVSLGTFAGNGDTITVTSGPLTNNTTFTTQATTAYGCMRTLAPVTVIIDRITFSCGIASQMLETGDTLQIVNNSLPAALTYSWNFGPAAVPATSTQAVPSNVVYTSAGQQSISLVATTPHGCTDSIQVSATVIPPYTADTCAFIRGAYSSGARGIISVYAERSGDILYAVNAGSSASHKFFLDRGDSLTSTYAPPANYGNRTLLVKTDEKGIHQWEVPVYTGSQNGVYMEMASDVNDNVYAVYYHPGATDTCRIFSADGSSVKFRPPFTSGGYRSFVLMKFNKDGKLQWYRTWLNDLVNEALHIECDDADGVYFTNNQYLVKYDTSGVFQWNTAGYYTELEFDSQGNLWAAQQSQGVALDRIDRAFGYVLQTLQVGTSSQPAFIEALEIDANNNFYVSGLLNSGHSITFPNLGTFPCRMFLAKITPAGQAGWIKPFTSTYEPSNAGMAVVNGMVVQSIYVQPFDAITYGSTTIPSPVWTMDLFLCDTLGNRDTLFNVHSSPMTYPCCSHIMLTSSYGPYVFLGGQYVAGSTFNVPVIPAYSNAAWPDYFIYRTDLSCLPVPPAAPLAAFTMSATGCPGDTIQLTDLSQPAPLAWSWSFPGGTPSASTLQNPQVSYAAGGSYVVTLTVTFASGSQAASQTVVVNSAPNTAISGDATPCSGSNASYTVSGAASYVWPDGNTAQTQVIPNIASDTVLSVIGYSAAGCPDTTVYNVTVLPLPVVTINDFSPDTACLSTTSIPLPSATPAGGVYMDNGGVLPGNTYNPNLVGPGLHPVWYVYIDANGCANSDTTWLVVDVCMDVAETVSSPVTTSVTGDGMLLVPQQYACGACSAIIMNALGQQVEVTLNESGTLDLRSYASGLYFVLLIDERGDNTHRIQYLKQ